MREGVRGGRPQLGAGSKACGESGETWWGEQVCVTVAQEPQRSSRAQVRGWTGPERPSLGWATRWSLEAWV